MEDQAISIVCSILTIIDLIIQTLAIFLLHKIAFCPLYLMILVHKKLPNLSCKCTGFISLSIIITIIMFPIIFLALEGIFYIWKSNLDEHIRIFEINSFNKIFIYLIALFLDYYYSYHYPSLFAKILAVIFFALQWSYQVIALEIFCNYLFQNWALFINYFASITRTGIILHFVFRNNILISEIYDKLYNELTERFVNRNLSSIQSDSEEKEENKEGEKKNGNNPLILQKEDLNEPNENFYSRLLKMNLRRDIPLESGERRHDIEHKEEFSEFPLQVNASPSIEIIEEPINSPDNEGKDLIETLIREINNTKITSGKIHLFCNISLIVLLHIIFFIVHK